MLWMLKCYIETCWNKNDNDCPQRGTYFTKNIGARKVVRFAKQTLEVELSETAIFHLNISHYSRNFVELRSGFQHSEKLK